MKPYEHGGNVKSIAHERAQSPDDWIDFSANINPLGLPEEIRYFLMRHFEDVREYPDPDSIDFVNAACDLYNIKPENVIPANGASEIFFAIMRVIPKKRAIIICPSYSDYEKAAKIENKEIIYHKLNASDNFALNIGQLSEKLIGEEVVILGRPNNPTGTMISKNEALNLINSHPDTVFIMDEAFVDFMEFSPNDGSLASYILPNLITVLSLTKMYSVAGLRIGLAVGHANRIKQLKSLQSSWPLNIFAQQTGALVLRDKHHAAKTRNYIRQQRTHLVQEISNIQSIQIFPSKVNFLLIKVSSEEIADKLYNYMLDSKILLRRCGNFCGLDNSFFRIAILSQNDNEKLVSALNDYFHIKKSVIKKKKTPALMIQGTGSNVGKSLLCTALCRIFLNEGYRVFPFKAQNMSLNSCVAMKGGEISRAQHLQSLAARVDSDVRMNPVLLKPVDKSISQIILLGKATGNFGFSDYRKNKDLVWKTVCNAYDELSENADIMIIEGAGSPVEMNLKDHDIVNMKMAEYAEARVILVGNIDYGGIFASITGTLALLEKKERERIIGLLVNQFRGDESLFIEGKKLLEKISGKEVLGIIPRIEKLMLPDEDSLAFSNRWNEEIISSSQTLHIAIVHLPHLSNFTDFDPFYPQKEITIQFIEGPINETPDVIIIPGSKNVIEDMQWLKDKGLADYIKSLRDKGQSEIIGLCGGFQMLGQTIKDPHCIESTLDSSGKEISGLGLLNINTELESDKILKKFSGLHLKSQLTITGYEIHHGRSSGNAKSIIESEAGFSSDDGLVWGTYIHGIFDEDSFRNWFINRLVEKKKLSPVNVVPYNVDEAIEKFSQIVKERLDMDKIKKLLNL